MSDWTNCEVQLPELWTPVLCYWDQFGDSVYMICQFVRRDNGPGYCFEGWETGVTHNEVTHWMQLPEPPKPKET